MKYSIIGLSIDFILSQLKDVSVLDGFSYLPANYLLINIIHVSKEYCLLSTLMIVDYTSSL